MDSATERDTVSFLSELFAEEMEGHPLIGNRSVWRQFPTIRNARWSAGHVVLLGDAAHTAHFSVGSGTRLAMLDGIALSQALDKSPQVSEATAIYENSRRPPVESLQRAARASLQWFEATERYLKLDPIQFSFSLLTRSLRISHENLRERDAAFVDEVDRWVARRAEVQARRSIAENEILLGVTRKGARPAPPPLFTPFRLRDTTLAQPGGALSAMCQYSAEDGLINDWHLVNFGFAGRGRSGSCDCRNDRRRQKRADLAGLCGYVPRRAHARMAPLGGLRSPLFICAGGHSTRPRRPQGVDPARLGGLQRASGAGRMADRLGLADPVLRTQPGSRGAG